MSSKIQKSDLIFIGAKQNFIKNSKIRPDSETITRSTREEGVHSGTS